MSSLRIPRSACIRSVSSLRSRTADQAHEHLAPLPGTDAALALGLRWVVVDRGAGQFPAVFYISVPASLGTLKVVTFLLSLQLS